MVVVVVVVVRTTATVVVVAVDVQHGGGSRCQGVLIVPGVSCRLGGADVCDAIIAHRLIGRHGRFRGVLRCDSTAIIFTQPIRVGQSVGTSGIQLGGFTDTCAYVRKRDTLKRIESRTNTRALSRLCC